MLGVVEAGALLLAGRGVDAGTGPAKDQERRCDGCREIGSSSMQHELVSAELRSGMHLEEW
jgi:hypothetical protein